MPIIPISDLKNAFASGDTPAGSDFSNLIDTTYNFPNTAANVTTGLTLTQTPSGIPVTVNGDVFYIPLFKAS